jgi:hypothetical protein
VDVDDVVAPVPHRIDHVAEHGRTHPSQPTAVAAQGGHDVHAIPRGTLTLGEGRDVDLDPAEAGKGEIGDVGDVHARDDPPPPLNVG